MATQGIPNNSPISFKELFKLLSTKQSLLDKVVLSISFKSILDSIRLLGTKSHLLITSIAGFLAFFNLLSHNISLESMSLNSIFDFIASSISERERVRRATSVFPTTSSVFSTLSLPISPSSSKPAVSTKTTGPSGKSSIAL